MIELKVPDIGDFKDVDIIEVFIKEGDTVKKEQSLITLETDKATMEVPSEFDGIIKSVKVKVGDKISEGGIIALIEISNSAPVTTPDPADEGYDCDLLVLGAGPGGYSAAFRAADLGLKVILVERYATLGGVCLNVGCIPSKALLHNAFVIEEAKHLSANGIEFSEPKIDLFKLRDYKSKVVNRLTSGLSGMAKGRKVNVIRGIGRYVDRHTLEIQLTTGSDKELTGQSQNVTFANSIIAAGSEVMKLPFAEDPRIIDSTGALELADIPESMLVIGGGIIGLEMATVYSTLGSKIEVVEMLDSLMAGADKDLVKVWQKFNSHRFKIMLQTKTVKVEAGADGIYVNFEGKDAPDEAMRYDKVLVAVGRSPNGKSIGIENLGIEVSDRGFIQVNKQMRTSVPNIFAIGDIVGQPMLAHKAVHEAHVAAEVVAGQRSFFDARVIPSVAYTDPEVAWVGMTEDQAKREGLKIKKTVFPWAASGRAIANGRDEGYTKLIFDPQTHRLIGGAIVGANAGDMIAEICLAIEMNCDAIDIAKTIHPHPTLGESIGMAAEVAHGSCTDLPPQKK